MEKCEVSGLEDVLECPRETEPKDCIYTSAYMHAKLLQSCPTLCNPMDCSLPGSSVYGDFPGKNTGMGCHTLLQGIFLTQVSNTQLLCLLLWQVDSFPQMPIPPGKRDTEIEGEKKGDIYFRNWITQFLRLRHPEIYHL